ncbi:MAG: DUF4233 domain-containing protein [Acidothermaceae bacterium]
MTENAPSEVGDQPPVDLAAHAAAVRRDAWKGKRRLTSSVLAMEVVVFWLAIIVAIVSSHVSATVAIPVGVALALACIAVAAMIKRRWAFRAGGALQVLAIGCGFAVPTMFVVGAVFALLWIAAIRIGDSAIRMAERYAASVGAAREPATHG